MNTNVQLSGSTKTLSFTPYFCPGQKHIFLSYNLLLPFAYRCRGGSDRGGGRSALISYTGNFSRFARWDNCLIAHPCDPQPRELRNVARTI